MSGSSFQWAASKDVSSPCSLKYLLTSKVIHLSWLSYLIKLLKTKLQCEKVQAQFRCQLIEKLALIGYN